MYGTLPKSRIPNYGQFLHLRVVLVIIMEFHWLIGRVCKDAPCMIVSVDAWLGYNPLFTAF